MGWKYIQGQMNVEDDFKKMQENSFDLLLWQTSIYEKIRKINFHKGVHIIRDPRDVIVSGYFSHLYSHSTDGWRSLEKHRDRLKRLNKDDGLYLEIEFSSYFIDHMANWSYSDPRILELRMEDVTSEPLYSLKKILDHFEVELKSEIPIDNALFYINTVFTKMGSGMRITKSYLSTHTLKKVINKNSFKKLSKGRTIGQENIKSHYRKGEAGDWKNHLKKGHLDRIYKKYRSLLVDRNYLS